MMMPNIEQAQDKKERKGLIPYLSRLLRGNGAVGAGGEAVPASAGSLFGGSSSGGVLSALLGTKAGIAGLAVGGMTLVAGAGLVYNVMSNNSPGAEAHSLFSDPYYDALVSDAESNRAAKSNVVDSRSSLDYLKEGQQGDEVFSEDAPAGAAGAEEQASSAESEEMKADAAAEAPAAVIPRLSAVAGVGSGSGGSSTSGGGSSSALGQRSGAAGGLSEGAVRTGSANGLKSAARAGLSGSSRKTSSLSGARNQAAAVNATLSGGGPSADSRRGALVDAYENSGKSGEVNPNGAGMSSGSGSSDPALNPKDSINLGNPAGSTATPETTEAEENDSPWKWIEIASYALMVASMLLLFIASKLAKTPASLPTAIILAKIALACAAVMTLLGILIMTTQGQLVQGLMLTAIGGITTFSAYKAMVGYETQLDQQKIEAETAAAAKTMTALENAGSGQAVAQTAAPAANTTSGQLALTDGGRSAQLALPPGPAAGEAAASASNTGEMVADVLDSSGNIIGNTTYKLLG
ncbi:MAG: hypothetical protein PHW69_02480 [Elusimicrobiaceae bacterium]|nr:hypothetical protein [Elusimicrobiaceae bacterium]